MGLIMLPLVLPEIIVAVSLLVVLLGMGVSLSIFTVILGHVLIATPYAIAILNTAFSSLDESLEEAAYDLGEGKWSTFRLITLPLVVPGIISSVLISFTISLDEFIIAFFLAGNEPTLPTYIFSQLRFPKAIPMIMALGHASSHSPSCCLPLLNISAVAASRKPAARIPEASCDRSNRPIPKKNPAQAPAGDAARNR